MSLRLGAKERVRFDRFGITSDTWETYPILRFSEVPALDVELAGDQRNPSLVVGEEGPTAAAIGKAVFDALGRGSGRYHSTQENIIAAMLD